MDYYILKRGTKQGPFGIDELIVQDLSPNTLIWKTGLSDWTEAKNIPELAELLKQLPPDPIEKHPIPKTWLVESILATILCCLPFGLIGIINATQVESLYFSGQYDEALRRSSQAKKWTLWGVGIMLAFFILYILVLVIAIIIGANS